VIRIGIDEAGYGPLLGPLVVGAAAYRVNDPAEGDVRRRLRGLVCRAGSWRRGRRLPVPIDDSKEVHGRHGVDGLARGVFGFLAAADHRPPRDLAEWLVRYGDRAAPSFPREPWFERPEEERFPAPATPADLRARFLLRGVEPLGLLVAPVQPRELNEAFERTGNKGRVLFLVTAAVLARALEAWPGEDLAVVLDREGGRLDYGAYLADVFPFHDLRRDPAPRGEARYLLRQGGRDVRLVFATRGDRLELSTGLASMAAKLTREMFLRRMNAWFVARQPGLRPTAGYVEDGRRFLKDAGPVLAREGVDLRSFVRSR
jgi:hypothetical protein